MSQLDDNLRGTLPMGRIVVQRLPDCEEIRLGLIDPAFPTGPLPAEVMRDVIAELCVFACDSDALARAACRSNALLNAIELQASSDLAAVASNDIDLVVMADVLYDKSNLALLDEVKRRFANVLVADSRVRELPDPDFQLITEINALTFPNLGEFDEFQTVRVFLYGTL